TASYGKFTRRKNYAQICSSIVRIGSHSACRNCYDLEIVLSGERARCVQTTLTAHRFRRRRSESSVGLYTVNFSYSRASADTLDSQHHQRRITPIGIVGNPLGRRDLKKIIPPIHLSARSFLTMQILFTHSSDGHALIFRVPLSDFPFSVWF